MEPEVWIVSGFITIVAVSLILALWFGRKAGFEGNARLREMAARLGIDYSETPPLLKFLPPKATVQGRIGGRRVRVHSFSRGSGKSRTQWVAARMECINPGLLKLSLRSQGPALLEKLAGAFGYKDIIIGDGSFDSTFAIHGSDEAFVRAALIPEIRQRLVAFWPKARGGKISIDDGEAVYEEMGSLLSKRPMEHLEKAFPVLADMAALAEVYRA